MSWKMKSLLAASLAANVVLIGVCVKSGGFALALNKMNALAGRDTQQNKETTIYTHRKSLFETLSVPENSIVFLGDSLTQDNEWHEKLSHAWIVNRGISGDTADGVLNRLDAIIKAKPSKLFLMIGINDLANGASTGEVTGKIGRIVERMKQESPGTRVYLESCLPVNSELYGSKVSNQDVQKVNAGLQAIAAKHNITYIDLYPMLLDGANLNKQYTKDGLHLNGEGYAVWAKAVAPHIN